MIGYGLGLEACFTIVGWAAFTKVSAAEGGVGLGIGAVDLIWAATAVVAILFGKNFLRVGGD